MGPGKFPPPRPRCLAAVEQANDVPPKTGSSITRSHGFSGMFVLCDEARSHGVNSPGEVSCNRDANEELIATVDHSRT